MSHRADPSAPLSAQSQVRVLVQRLDELGWTEGRNLRIDYRWGAAERGQAQGM